MTHEEIARKIIADEYHWCRGRVVKVWECKTLQHWKGIFADIDTEPKQLWEITYDGDVGQYFSDRYSKSTNKAYPKGAFEEAD